MLATANSAGGEQEHEVLHLFDGQLLLMLKDNEARRAGGEGGTQLGVVMGRSAFAKLVAATGERALIFDACSQVVLPWAGSKAAWAEALLRDVNIVRDIGGPPPVGAELQQLEEFAEKVERVLPHIVETRLRDPIANGIKAARQASREQQTEAGELDSAFQKRRSGAFRQVLARAIDPEQFELLFAEIVRASGALGARRYAAGQALVVQQQRSASSHVEWVDVKVLSSLPDGTHTLQAERGPEITKVLHPWNHAPRTLPGSAFTAAFERYATEANAQHGCISDALSGRSLDVFEQLVPVTATITDGRSEQPRGVSDAQGLFTWLESLHTQRCTGAVTTLPVCALLTAGPAAGKTVRCTALGASYVRARASHAFPLLPPRSLAARSA